MKTFLFFAMCIVALTWLLCRLACKPSASRIDDEHGATAIEYCLIAALIALACIIAFLSLGLNLGNVFNTVADGIGGKV